MNGTLTLTLSQRERGHDGTTLSQVEWGHDRTDGLICAR